MDIMTRDAFLIEMNKLTSSDVTDTERIEIVNQIGQAYNASSLALEARERELDIAQTRLNESRDAMAIMYNQINRQNITTNQEQTETEKEKSFMETVTVDDLINHKRKRR